MSTSSNALLQNLMFGQQEMGSYSGMGMSEFGSNGSSSNNEMDQAEGKGTNGSGSIASMLASSIPKKGPCSGPSTTDNHCNPNDPSTWPSYKKKAAATGYNYTHYSKDETKAQKYEKFCSANPGVCPSTASPAAPVSKPAAVVQKPKAKAGGVPNISDLIAKGANIKESALNAPATTHKLAASPKKVVVVVHKPAVVQKSAASTASAKVAPKKVVTVVPEYPQYYQRRGVPGPPPKRIVAVVH